VGRGGGKGQGWGGERAVFGRGGNGEGNRGRKRDRNGREGWERKCERGRGKDKQKRVSKGGAWTGVIRACLER